MGKSREETRDDITYGVGNISIIIKSMWCTYIGNRLMHLWENT